VQRFQVRSFAVVALITLVAASGCGSGTKAASSSSSPAEAVPDGALLYADVNLDQGSSAWQQFATVSKRFPGWQRLVDTTVHSFDDSSNGTSYERDIAPWLGDSAGVALTSVDVNGGKPSFVAFVASKDDGKAKSAVAGDKNNHPDGDYNGYSQYRSTSTNGGEVGVGDGAVIFASDTQTLHDAIDVRAGKADSLADDSNFSAAMANLPKDSLVRGYADPAKLAQLASLAQLSGQAPGTSAQQLATLTKALGSLDSASFSMFASSGGYNAVFHVHVKDGADPGLFGAQSMPALTLTSMVPADAFLFLGTKLSTPDAFTKSFTQGLGGGGSQQLKQFEQLTGLSVQRDIAPLFTGELLLYAAPGLPARGALLLKPADPAAAAAGLERLTAFAARARPGLHIKPLGGGRQGQSLELSPGFTFSWQLTADGLIAIGNDTAAGSKPGAPLLESAAYTSLLSKAQVPAGANVLAYVSVPGILQLVPSSVDPNLRPLGGIVEWGSKDGNDVSFGLFAEVK
jgi:Protein of unknown function (DUF3352)